MKPLDYALLALIGLWLAWAVRRIVRQRRRGGCCGCSSCETSAPEKACRGACSECARAGGCRRAE